MTRLESEVPGVWGLVLRTPTTTVDHSCAIRLVPTSAKTRAESVTLAITKELYDAAPTGLAVDENLYLSTFPNCGVSARKPESSPGSVSVADALVSCGWLEIATQGRTTANDLSGFGNQREASPYVYILVKDLDSPSQLRASLTFKTASLFVSLFLKRFYLLI